MINLNMLGKACPIPVIETKKAIQELRGGEDTISVLADNEIACENIKKMTDGLGLESSYERLSEDQYLMKILVVQKEEETEKKTILKEHTEKNLHRKWEEPSENILDNGMAVAIGADTMGRGAQELGRILIKSFIYSLTELENIPTHVIFFNSGAHLVCEGANTIEDLKKLEKMGTKILVCGTCVDYYGLKSKIAVGEIVNMYTIATILSASTKVVEI